MGLAVVNVRLISTTPHLLTLFIVLSEKLVYGVLVWLCISSSVGHWHTYKTTIHDQ